MRKLLLSALVVLLALMPAMVSAQGDPAMKALDWLESQQAEDGSFAGGDPGITASAAISLALLERPNQAAMDYLETYVAENLDSMSLDAISTTLLAVVANDPDPAAFADGILVETLSTKLPEERGGNTTALCSGLVAMAEMGMELPPTAIEGVKALQNEDGGFGQAAGTPSLPVFTSVCLHVLVSAGETEAVEAAINYLDSAQLEDGGWATLVGETSDGFGTAYTLMGLAAADEDLMGDWSDAVNFLLSQQDSETGEVTALPAELAGDLAPSLNVAATAVFALVFRGLSLNDILPDEETAAPTETEEPDNDASAATGEEGPALDSNWAAIQDGFGMDELDTADDFFVTVIDPFTNEELYGVEIINWVAEYQYTGYIIERFLPAEVLLWMNEQDPTTFENISDATLTLLPDDVLAELPEALQARAGE